MIIRKYRLIGAALVGFCLLMLPSCAPSGTALQAYAQNGIKFAFPTVSVTGEGEPAAAVAHRALELTTPAAA